MSSSLKRIIHVGYVLDDPELKSKLEPFIGDRVNDLKSKVYTATLFYRHSSQSDMSCWFRKKSRKGTLKGYLKQVYIVDKYVVGVIVVDGRYEYITLVCLARTPPVCVKQLANSGQLGEPAIIEEIVELLFTPYCEQQ